jgi:hypothetical protein
VRHTRPLLRFLDRAPGRSLIGEFDESSRAWLDEQGSRIAHAIILSVSHALLPPYYLACDLIALPFPQRAPPPR